MAIVASMDSGYNLYNCLGELTMKSGNSADGVRNLFSVSMVMESNEA